MGAGRFSRTGMPRRKGHSERGSVTAETAIVLPVVSLLVVALALVGNVVIAQTRVAEAARSAARVLSWGEDSALAERRAQQVAGDQAIVRISKTAQVVSVTVSTQIDVVPLGLLPQAQLNAEADATAYLEPHLNEETP